MDGKFLEGEISSVISEEKACQRVVSVEVSAERFRDEKAKVLKEMAKEVSLPGFRKGKVPIEVVERHFADEIRAEAIKSILPRAFDHVVADRQLEPVADPEFRDIKSDEDKPLTFTVCVEVLPKMNIEYRGVAPAPEEVSVTEEEVEEVVKSLLDRAADFVKVERPSALGDVVTLDFAPVAKDGTVNEKRRVTNYPVQLGAGQIFPAFEEAVTGKAAGDKGRVEVDYPADYKPERLAGKKINYDYAVVDVREKQIPPLDDEFAAKMDANLKTVTALRDDIRMRLMEEKRKEERRHREERAIDVIIERSPFEVPQSMRERFKKELYREDERRRASAGVGPEADEEKRARMEELFDRIALRNIKRYFIMDYVAEKEGVTVSDEEVERELQAIAEASGRPFEEVRKLVARDGEKLGNLKNRLRERKIFEIILGGSSEAQDETNKERKP
jgi:trigger factor